MRNEMTPEEIFVSPQWVKDRQKSAGLKIVDGSWYMPATKRNCAEEFEQVHIPGAVFFDQDKIVDPSSSFPHTVPSPVVFADAAGKLGISTDDEIVIYETGDLFAAPRVWWLFHIMGVQKLHILRGGIAAWQAERFETEAGKAAPLAVEFKPYYAADKVVFIEEMVLIAKHAKAHIVDARSAERFTGAVPEPRANVRSGSIPSSKNMPFGSLVENGGFKSLETMKLLFESQGVKKDKPVVTTCGSGVTAAVLFLALNMLNYENVRLYDGSWTEWGTVT
ncbi:3-mercaptopyruvate sulfurtransferase [Pseudochrobactrum kiredjianiae]|uniref:Sulfurtransferase n=1 Tax=Pseudochrobactrum kiredjianiae TaxID=386305 RepID=A0ABW3V0T2_9HYPH|nr:3-mercaptopyruvate sulfurtransferase [Pseudochrobactrum kiredjianiae]MDM7852891.1 3-mercaptopyruvate sulfurtransferase [Pseudochrobactrum kiredjianiae]